MAGQTLVEIACDGNGKIGLGHLRRSQTLARQLELEGLQVRLVGVSQAARDLLPAACAPQGLARVTVLDVPGAPQELLDAARRTGSTVVGLDWFGDEDVDVNIVVYPHQAVRAQVATHVGWPYVMIRSEIAHHPAPGLPVGHRKVLVFLGGGDVLGQGHAAARLLVEAGLDVVLVQGPLAQDRAAGAGYQVRVNPPDLPEMLAQCDWTVTNGGTCMFESLCMGKPPYVLPQTEAEERVSAAMAAEGVLLGRGLAQLGGFELPVLKDTAQRGIGVIDGRGVTRVSAIVRELM